MSNTPSKHSLLSVIVLPHDASSALRTLNLPMAVEALDRPIGLPPSLLSKAEEVRTDRGPERIDQAVEDVKTLARRAQKILDDVRVTHLSFEPSHL